jgi:ABC-type transport system involved in multi-copper enzyme maturation permease subunit
MVKLLKIELKKILTYKVFWILMGLYFLFLVLGILMAGVTINSWIDNINKHSPIPFPHVTIYFFPDIWQNITFFASIRFILILPAIVIIILITNEFTNKTIRQNIVNGMSRQEFLLSKLQLIFLISLLVTFILILGTVILGIANTDNQGMTMMFKKISFTGGFFIQVFSFLVFAFFLGFILRNTGLSIAIFTLYALIIEPVLYFILKIPKLQPNNISQFLPVNSVIRVVEYPYFPVLKKIGGLNVQEHLSLLDCTVPLIYAGVMIGIVYWVLSRKDL